MRASVFSQVRHGANSYPLILMLGHANKGPGYVVTVFLLSEDRRVFVLGKSLSTSVSAFTPGCHHWVLAPHLTLLYSTPPSEPWTTPSAACATSSEFV